jgi:hypothetical protein
VDFLALSGYNVKYMLRFHKHWQRLSVDENNKFIIGGLIMSKNTNNQELRKLIAKLESKVDHLETEFMYVNELLVQVGFPEGIETLKIAAEELLSETIENAYQRKNRPFDNC